MRGLERLVLSVVRILNPTNAYLLIEHVRRGMRP
jgi:hypothetical protein